MQVTSRDLQGMLQSYVKALGSALKLKPPRHLTQPQQQDVVSLAAAVADWAAVEGGRFVRAKVPAYVEALQRFHYLSSPTAVVEPSDPSWKVQACSATPLTVLEALASTYALQVSRSPATAALPSGDVLH